ncbi:MAG: molybdopterin cofactor-binding domain-containing protein [Rhodospirillales bacterium]
MPVKNITAPKSGTDRKTSAATTPATTDSGFEITRRTVLTGAGALVVSFGIPGVKRARAKTAGDKPPLMPDELDSFIKISEDDTVTAFFGKMDMGQGVDVAIGQIVADELDVPFKQVHVLMGDTKYTVNQGGGSGSTGIQKGGIPLRQAAAEARGVLLKMASEKFGVPADKLTVDGGVISVPGTRKKVRYGELIGRRHFNVKMTWNKKYGNNLVSKGTVKPKDPKDYKIVGKSYPRNDIPAKMHGTFTFVTDVRVPGMMHGRVIRPPKAGATPLSVDDSSIKAIPGVRIVRDEDFVGVVAEHEWNAVKAAEALKITWSDSPANFPDQDALYDHIRQAPVIKDKSKDKDIGDVDAAFAKAAKIVEAEYEWPFQSHASMGPACAVVDIREDGATVWTGSQKPHYGQACLAKFLGMDMDKVRAIWTMGPGSYGRNDAGDAVMDAAVLAKAVGRPVRFQGMRVDGTAWDPKAPASVHYGRAGLDADGNVIAYRYLSKGFDRQHVRAREVHPRETLSGQLVGNAAKPLLSFRNPEETYGFPNKRLGWQIIPQLLDHASPLRTSHFRDPVGPQAQFGSESFIDEMALAANADPVEFRLKYIKRKIDHQVVAAAAEKAGWQPRVGPANKPGGTSTVSGRGIAYAQRNGATVAIVAEIEVDRATGKIWPRKFTVAHECGLIVNPEGLKLCIEGNVTMMCSRMLHEEVTFDKQMVTSTDWATYPILDSLKAPETIDFVLIDRPNVMPKGAGEPSTRPMAGAIANAFFDATGVRLRRAPFTADRVKKALA